MIGTGASAVQFVPPVAEQAESCTCSSARATGSCRGATGPYPAPVRAAIRLVPGVQAFRRRFIYYYTEALTLMIRHPRTLGLIGRLISTVFMRRQLRDPEVRRRAWPHYTFGCKRVLFSSHFLPALQRPNVELVTDAIDAPDAGRDRDRRRGRARSRLHDLRHRLSHHRVHVPDGGQRRRRPSRCARRGPRGRTPTWACASPVSRPCSSSTAPTRTPRAARSSFYEEAQAAYIRQALSLLRDRGRAAIEVRPEVEAASDRELQSRFAGTAWTQCNSWYRDDTGRIVTNWPGYMTDYAAARRASSTRPSSCSRRRAPPDDPRQTGS